MNDRKASTCISTSSNVFLYPGFHYKHGSVRLQLYHKISHGGLNIPFYVTVNVAYKSCFQDLKTLPNLGVDLNGGYKMQTLPPTCKQVGQHT